MSAEPRLWGVSLAQYAGVQAGLAEGAPRDAVVANEGVDAARFELAELAWAELLADSLDEEGSLASQYDERLVAAQTRYGRAVEPLDSDLGAWAWFLVAMSAQEEPSAWLQQRGLRAGDVIRLTRRWSARLENEPALMRAFGEAVQSPGELRELVIGPMTLEPPAAPPTEMIDLEPPDAAEAGAGEPSDDENARLRPPLFSPLDDLSELLAPAGAPAPITMPDPPGVPERLVIRDAPEGVPEVAVPSYLKPRASAPVSRHPATPRMPAPTSEAAPSTAPIPTPITRVRASPFAPSDPVLPFGPPSGTGEPTRRAGSPARVVEKKPSLDSTVASAGSAGPALPFRSEAKVGVVTVAGAASQGKALPFESRSSETGPFGIPFSRYAELAVEVERAGLGYVGMLQQLRLTAAQWFAMVAHWEAQMRKSELLSLDYMRRTAEYRAAQKARGSSTPPGKTVTQAGTQPETQPETQRTMTSTLPSTPSPSQSPLPFLPLSRKAPAHEEPVLVRGWTVEQYASLCVDASLDRESALVAYRLDSTKLREVHDAWSAAMDKTPALRRRWMDACEKYREWLDKTRQR